MGLLYLTYSTSAKAEIMSAVKANPVTFSAELHLSVVQVSQFKLRRPFSSVVDEIQPIVVAIALQPMVAGGRHPLAIYSFPSLPRIKLKMC